MILLSCDDCGKTQETESTICPNCGSNNILINHALPLSILEQVTIKVGVRHRMWEVLPAGIESLLRDMERTDKESGMKGKCLMVICSSAFLVEGILTDYIEMEGNALGTNVEKKEAMGKILENLDGIGWGKKVKRAAALNWDLEALDGFGLVSVLFDIRNNLGHGRSYSIFDTRKVKEEKLQRSEPVGIINKNYDGVYRKLFELGLVPSIEHELALSTELFLRPELAKAFYESAVVFLRSFFGAVHLTSEEDLRDSFERAVAAV